MIQLAKILKNKELIKLAAIIVVVVLAWRYFNKWQARAASKQLTKDIDKEIIQNNASFAESDYQSMADQMFIAMNGAGTNSDDIYKIVSLLKTRTDWLKLVQSFGVKESSSWYSSFSGNLVEWLSDELDSSEKAKINYSLQRFNVQV